MFPLVAKVTVLVLGRETACHVSMEEEEISLPNWSIPRTVNRSELFNVFRDAFGEINAPLELIRLKDFTVGTTLN